MTVLDASVITKWFKPDEKSVRADFYLEEHATGRNPIFVPTLLTYELINALWMSKKLPRFEVERAMAALAQVRLAYVNPDQELIEYALLVSEETGLSIYDSSYVALAHRLNCTLVTADRKLYRKAGAFADIHLL